MPFLEGMTQVITATLIYGDRTMSDTEPTITELFARDPFTYTKEDLDRIIAHYREARRQFNLGGKGAKVDKPTVNLVALGLA